MADSKRSRDTASADGRRSVSIRDVAEAAGVSVATVSRALRPDSENIQIRPETRQRVLRTSERLGYQPNDLARALLHQRTSVIGLVVPDISNSYYAGLVRGAEDAASARGYRVVLCNTDRELSKLQQYLDALVKSRVDGIIIAGGAADESIDSRMFEQYGTRAVFVGRHDPAYASVQIDNVAAGRDITSYLLGLGHRRVAFLAGPLASHTFQDRLTGYQEALVADGVEPSDALMREGRLDEESGYRGTEELVRGTSRPTAVICANDRVAVGALAALADLDLPVPERVSVAGFDDVSVSSYLRPKLTTVAIPTYDIGTSVAELLLDQLQADTESARTPGGQQGPVLLPTELVVRESCAAPVT